MIKNSNTKTPTAVGIKNVTMTNTAAKHQALQEKLVEIENAEFSRKAMDYILFVLMCFTNSLNRLTIGQISVLISRILPECSTKNCRKKFNDAIQAIAADKNLSIEEKRREHYRISREYSKTRLRTIERTVFNNLKQYFESAEEKAELIRAFRSQGANYISEIDTLRFMENIRRIRSQGQICQAYDNNRRCKVYWFDHVLDVASIRMIEKMLDDNQELSDYQRELIKRNLIAYGSPAYGALVDAGKTILPQPVKDAVYDDSLDVEDVRYYLSLPDEFDGVYENDLTEHLDAA